jgi:branched-chain amino acid aminotransferase
MRKEAEDFGVEFTVSIDGDGFLAEGGTENVGIITADRRFLVPRFDRIIRGITVTRMMQLARGLISTGELAAVEEADITREDAYQASEIMLFGTTFDVMAAVNYDGRTVGEGKPGPTFHKFLELFKEDLRSGREMLTPVKES